MAAKRPTFNEITRYYEIIEALITLDKRIREHTKNDYSLYRGLQILMTPLVIRPKVMLIGINPGSGYFNNYKNEGLEENNPIYIIDHRPSNNNPFDNQNTICQLIQACFDPIDLQSIQKKPVDDLVWCNICPVATEDASKYRKLLDIVGTGYAWKTIHRTIHQLASLINPQLIICLGKEAFDEYCNNQFIQDIDIIKKRSSAGQNIFRAESLKTHTPIIGMSRLYNNLQCDKQELQQLIHSLLTKHHEPAL